MSTKIGSTQTMNKTREYVGNWYVDLNGTKTVDVYCRHNVQIAKLRSRRVVDRDDLVLWVHKNGNFAWERICSRHHNYEVKS